MWGTQRNVDTRKNGKTFMNIVEQMRYLFEYVMASLTFGHLE